MSPVDQGGKVLVSGANGFIAVWVVNALLEAGFSVRGTVRDERKAVHLHKIFGVFGKGRFESVVVGDIAKPGAFDEALLGVDAIAHTASSVSFAADDPNELIVPAVEGTLSILESALKSKQIKRVVLLSSSAAITGDNDRGVIDESTWNEEAINDVKEHGRAAKQQNKYRASKTLAEKAAWNFVEKHQSSGITWDLVALCPSFVFGPIMHELPSPDRLNATMHEFAQVVFKGVQRPAEFQASWIDVRDVATAHVLALKDGEAVGGKRFLLSGGMFVWQDVYDAVNGLAIPGVSAPVGTPGIVTHFKKTYNTHAAESVLGLKFTDLKTTARDIITSLKEHGYPF